MILKIFHRHPPRHYACNVSPESISERVLRPSLQVAVSWPCSSSNARAAGKARQARVAPRTGRHGFGPAPRSDPSGKPAEVYGRGHSFPYDSSLRFDDSCRVGVTQIDKIQPFGPLAPAPRRYHMTDLLEPRPQVRAKLTARAIDASGNAYFSWRSSSAKWISIKGLAGTVGTPARQARWR